MVTVLVSRDFELGSSLVECHSMPKVSWLIVWRAAQRQCSGYEADTGNAVEHADEIHIDIDAEGPFELGTHHPPFRCVVFVEPVD